MWKSGNIYKSFWIFKRITKKCKNCNLVFSILYSFFSPMVNTYVTRRLGEVWLNTAGLGPVIFPGSNPGGASNYLWKGNHEIWTRINGSTNYLYRILWSFMVVIKNWIQISLICSISDKIFNDLECLYSINYWVLGKSGICSCYIFLLFCFDTI